MKPGAKIARVGSLSPGNVVAIPLGDDTLAYARVYRGAVGVYFCSNGAVLPVEQVARQAPRKWFYYCSLPGGRYERDWLYVGDIPFAHIEDSWPPPMSATDTIAVKPRLYWKGSFLQATDDDLVGKQRFIIYGFSALKDQIAKEASLRLRQ